MRAAFTLLELVLVLAVVAALVAVVAARLSPLRQRTVVQGAAQQLQQALDGGRRLAVEQGQAVQVQVDLDRGAVATVAVDPLATAPTQPSAWSVLADGPDALLLSVSAGAGEVTAGSLSVVFLPDHRCATPGSATFALGGYAAVVRWDGGARPAQVAMVELP